jgi:alkane 1-monooxygenase
MIYLVSSIIPVLCLWALVSAEFLVWITPMIYTFGLIPLLDYLLPMKISGRNQPKNDFPLILVSCLHLMVFFYSLFYLRNISGMELVLKSIAIGISAGGIGINCAHELGHRPKKAYQNFAKLLLFTSFYMHFFTEHNKGHHRHVSTPNDPASSRFNESLYKFLPRTIIMSLISAFKIDKKEVSIFLAIEFGFTIFLALLFGVNSVMAYLIISITGILMLEVVNYIEHYGLERKFNGKRYEKTTAKHSWDSDYFFSSVHLFNLSLHSDHHALASKKFYDLKPNTEAPQMPTGYAGMMLLALIPPLWFKTMNPKIEAFKAAQT